jgi:hypothetical protein
MFETLWGLVLTGECLPRYQTSAGMRVHAREWTDVQGAGDVYVSSIGKPHRGVLLKLNGALRLSSSPHAFPDPRWGPSTFLLAPSRSGS